MDASWQQEWSLELCTKLAAQAERLPHRVELSRTSNTLIGPDVNDLRDCECQLQEFAGRSVRFTFWSTKGKKSCHFHLRDHLDFISGKSTSLDDAVEVALTWISGSSVQETMDRHPILHQRTNALEQLADAVKKQFGSATPLRVKFKYEASQYDHVDLISGDRCVEAYRNNWGGTTYYFFQHNYSVLKVRIE